MAVQVLTFVVVALASTVIFMGSRPIALVAYMAGLCLYPQYLALSIGSVDWSTGRLLGIVLFARMTIRQPDPWLIRLRAMDYLVLLTYAAAAATHFLNDPF